MRKLVSFLVLLTMGYVTYGQQGSRGDGSQVAPQLVEQKFQSEFPKATQVSWERKDNRYLARFIMNGYQMYALYTSAGLWLFTDIKVPIEKVPAKAKQHCSTNFGDFSIVRSGFHDSMNSGSYYVLTIKKNGVMKKAKYDENGNFLGLN